MGNTTSKQVASGMFWKFGERIVAQGVSFIVSTVLARLLMPEEYGTVALVLVMINLANVFITSGFGDAAIQRKDVSDKDFSTVFYCNLGFSLILYAILFISAPAISMFYENEQLCDVVRVLSLQIPLGSFKTIQHAYVTKNMQFKKFFFSTLGGTLVSGIIGIVAAVNGFGVWALVMQYLFNSIIDMLVLFVTVSWKPQLYFDFNVAKEMFGFGWKITAAKFLNALYSNARSMIIGKFYSPADLAYYNKGDHFPALLINNVNTSISTVLFPVMSKENDNMQRLKQVTRRAMKTSSYIIYPLMFGLMAVSRPLVILLLTEKWIGCVPFLCISCCFWMFQPVQTANAEVIKALGRSDIYLSLEFKKKIIGFGLIVLSMPFGVYAITISNAVFAGISMLMNIMPNKKLINYGYLEQIKDVAPSFFCSLLMAVIVYAFQYFIDSYIICIIVQFIVGVVVYVGISIILRIDSFNYLCAIIKGKR